MAFYRSWKVFDPGRKHSVDARFAAMPVLTKKDIRDHSPSDFSPNSHELEQRLAKGLLELVKTSGSIDDSVTNVWNQEWWNASEKASWKLNSYAAKTATGSHREAILVSPLNVGFVSDEVALPMEKRRLSRFLYLNEKTSTLLWTPEHMDRMIREMEEFKPEVLEANPSLLAKLCRYVLAYGKEVFQPKLIVLTYEYPSSFHCRQIREVFDTPIASSYGSTETGYVFMECEEGKFHQNSEFCRVDFQPFKHEHGGPTLGRILVTTFNNPWYYILRFDVGDLVRVDEEGGCLCGREAGLILSSVEGRTANITLTCNGRLVTLRELDNTLAALEDVDEYQLFQTSAENYRLHLVSQRKDKSRLKQEAKGLLRKLYGEEAEISVVFEAAIAPEASGKYSLSQTLFPVEIKDYLDKETQR